MKTFSRLAPGLALAAMLAASGVTATSALAKDKKEAAKPGMKFSPEVLKAAQVAQPAIAARNFPAAEPAVAQVEAAAVTEEDKYLGAALRYDLEQAKLVAAQAANPNAPIDETVLAKPLDALIASPSTPADVRGKYAYRRGVLSFNGKQYPQALRYFAQAKQFGYTDENIDPQIAQAKIGSGDVKGGLADLSAIIDAQVAAGKKPPEDYYKFGLGKAYGAKLQPETFAWMRKYLSAYPTPKNWRAVIVVYGFQQNPLAVTDNAQKIDLFRLMRAAKALADQTDYQDYAQRVLDRGLPSETKSVLQEGMASGKIPASSATAKTLMASANKGIASEGSLAGLEKRSASAADGKLASQTGDAYLGQENFPKAIELYRLALQKGGVNADEVNTHLGIALARSGDKLGATAAFAAVTGQPRADIAALWTTWLATQA